MAGHVAFEYEDPPNTAAMIHHVHDLVFDSACGLYVVVGLTDCYYDDGYFYRLRAGVWEISVRADEWRIVTYEMLPPRLKVKAGPITKIDTGRPVKPNGKGPVKVSGNADNKPISFASNAEGKAKGPTKGKH